MEALCFAGKQILKSFANSIRVNAGKVEKESLIKSIVGLNDLIDKYEEGGNLSGEAIAPGIIEQAILCIIASRNHSQFKHRRALELERRLFDAIRWTVAACLEGRPHIEIADYLKDYLK